MAMPTSPQAQTSTPQSIKALMDLLESRQAEWRFSLEHIWKINLTVWGALALFLVSDYRSKSHIPHAIVIAGLIGILVGHLLWLYQGRNVLDTVSASASYILAVTFNAIQISSAPELDTARVFPKLGHRWFERIRSYEHFYVDASITIILIGLNVSNWLY
jgi:xanthosine utilization system XapX-like protein